MGVGRRRAGRVEAYPLSTPSCMLKCVPCVCFFTRMANTLLCGKMLNPELILYFEIIPIDLSPTSVSSSRVCLK